MLTNMSHTARAEENTEEKKKRLHFWLKRRILKLKFSALAVQKGKEGKVEDL